MATGAASADISYQNPHPQPKSSNLICARYPQWILFRSRIHYLRITDIRGHTHLLPCPTKFHTTARRAPAHPPVAPRSPRTPPPVTLAPRLPHTPPPVALRPPPACCTMPCPPPCRVSRLQCHIARSARREEEIGGAGASKERGRGAGVSEVMGRREKRGGGVAELPEEMGKSEEEEERGKKRGRMVWWWNEGRGEREG